MALRRIIDTLKGIEPEDEPEDADEVDDLCADSLNRWGGYPAWAWDVPSKALVAARDGNGVVLYAGGPCVRYYIEEEGQTGLDDLGLDDAPDGLSVWEGIYVKEGRVRWEDDDDNDTIPKGAFRPLSDKEWEAVMAGRNPWQDKDWRGEHEDDATCARCKDKRCRAESLGVDVGAPETNCVTCAWANKPSDFVRALAGMADVWECAKVQGHHSGVDMPTKAWRMMNVDGKGRPTASGCPGHMRDNLREDCFSCHWAKVVDEGRRLACNTPKRVEEADDWSGMYRSTDTGLPFQDGTPPPCPGYSRRR